MEPTNENGNLLQIAEVQLIYRSNVKASRRPQITTSRDTYRILTSLWDNDVIELLEQFQVLLLNRSNRVLGVYQASSGGLTGTIADPRLILAVAIKAAASSIILAHNHPSGNLAPSKTDIELTRKIQGAGGFLDVLVLDHIIVTPEGYYSFADEGLL